MKISNFLRKKRLHFISFVVSEYFWVAPAQCIIIILYSVFSVYGLKDTVSDFIDKF